MSQENFIKYISSPIQEKKLYKTKSLKDEKLWLNNSLDELSRFSPNDEFYEKINFLSENKYSAFMHIIGKKLDLIFSEQDALLAIEKTKRKFPELSNLFSLYFANLIAMNKYDMELLIENLPILNDSKENFVINLFSQISRKKSLTILSYFDKSLYPIITESIFLNNKHFNFFKIEDVLPIVKKYKNNDVSMYLLKKNNTEKINAIAKICVENPEYLDLLFTITNRTLLQTNKSNIEEIIKSGKELDFPNNLYLLILYRLNITQKKEDKILYSNQIFDILIEKNKIDDVISKLYPAISIPELNYKTHDNKISNMINEHYIIYFNALLSKELITDLPEKKENKKVVKI